MKEFYEKNFFDDCLKIGLRSDHRRQRNIPGLVRCSNTRPIEGIGLVGNDIIKPIISQAELDRHSIEVDFPFPQIFRGMGPERNVGVVGVGAAAAVDRGDIILADKNAIYRVRESDWTLSQITTYDAYNTSNAKSIPDGGAWHFIDYGPTWMLINGSCTVFLPYKETIFGNVEKALIVDDVRIETGCTFKGRTIIGGFDSSHFWNEGWRLLWDEWAATWPGGVEKIGYHLDKNFVLWSDIGGDILWLFYSDLAEEGLIPYTDGGSDTGFDSSWPLIMDMFRRNELGWMPMPRPGKVRRVMTLNNRIIVYGDHGVSSLYPVVEPATTFGLKHLLDVGVYDRGSVGGDDKDHVFVDSNFNVWKINGDEYNPTRLGYKKHFPKVTNGRSVLVTLDPEVREFYISIEDACYVLTSAGLGSNSQILTSGMLVDGEFRGIYRDSGDNSILVITNEFDFSLRSIKTIESVEIGSSKYENMSVCFLVKYEGDKIYRQTDWVSVSEAGTAVPIVSAIDFRLVISATPYEEVDIDSITVRWKLSDKRNIRGIYAK